MQYMLVCSCNYNAVCKNSNFVKMVDTWNNLSFTPCRTESQNAFKSNYKIHYFEEAYGSALLHGEAEFNH